ncbi:MAG: succinate dehydrogenase, hydrophobic membrane anchor protein [Methylococcales bacterium]|jgi:succinate dehydrogenase / fumarate reductase, membrane anchor subunit|nr:succinate dehydrogenase, hydrophobic membrane anchor protein [Methylococcales bacterium]MBT7445811.1 succinate dehydrogenase, hydrophobic membrane anchor protein [Methylococcales bacterium]
MSRQFQGLKAWLMQRVTAVYLLCFLIYFMGVLLVCPPEDYQAWRSWVATPWISISMSVFIISLALHAWVGMRDIFIDYIKPIGLKIGLLSLLGLALISSVFWALQAIVLLQLGGQS